ncbi:glycosyltransferase family 39 protein [Pedobacter aquatilis]|uniref:ArnT family glycosyltransferase n=1 Tax=Pedobacter aquatilis TaxID=351343 RepID=UPI0025B526E1|nr:glycosyltransferase family 39 protein [Pedobacter aquatilis]MDN3586001.1 glycosyltransferase family 39 protein [Pedobacter aquatilis]
MSKDFAFGYLDISPLITWIAAIASLIGNSLTAWRFFPSLFSAFTVVLTGKITQIVGGRNLAVCIACSAVICSPAFLATSYLLQPAVFDQFFWVLLTYTILSYHKYEQPKDLYACALALSFGMLNKYTIICYPIVLLLSYILTTGRYKCLVSKKMGGPVLLMLIVIFPNFLWQWNHGFPILHYSVIVTEKTARVDIGDYLFQLFFFHGASVAIWTAGCMFLLFKREKNALEISFLLCLLTLLVGISLLPGKLYYVLGIFPIFFAYGGLCWEILLFRKSRIQIGFFFTVLYSFSVLSLPLVIPLFTLNFTRIYISKMVSLTGFRRPLLWQDGHVGKLPQFFADMTCWSDFAAGINSVANKSTVKPILVYTDNYAIAGALKYYGDQNDLPVISPSNSFILEAPKSLSGRNIILISKKGLKHAIQLADNVKIVGVHNFENSHLRCLHIYILNNTNERFQQQFLKEKKDFYPGETDVSSMEVLNSIDSS